MGCCRIGPRERIDALAALVRGVGEDRFRDHHATPQAIEERRLQDHLAARIMNPQEIALDHAEARGILRVDHQMRLAFPLDAAGCFVEGGVQEGARRRRDKPEGVGIIRRLDHRPMVGETRHRLPRAHQAVIGERHFPPVRREMEPPVAMAEAGEIMRPLERRIGIDEALFFNLFERALASLNQREVDMLARAHVEAGMLRAKAPGEPHDHLVVRAA